MNPRSAWIPEQVPALRIVDQSIWEQAQDRLGGTRAKSGADRPNRPKFWENRRSQHLLTGKVFCGACGGAMSAVGLDSLACNAARRQGICSSRAGIRRQVVETLILDALRDRLMQPDAVAVFIEEYTTEWNRLQLEASAQVAVVSREMEGVERKLAGLIEAISDGFGRACGLQQRLDELEARKAALPADLSRVPPSAAPRLHPGPADIYRERVTDVQAALRSGAEATAILEHARSLIDRMVLHAGEQGPEIELIAEIAAMVDLALGRSSAHCGTGEADSDRGLFYRSVKMVAGKGNHRELTPLRVSC
jgi:hypothetical protein